MSYKALQMKAYEKVKANSQIQPTNTVGEERNVQQYLSKAAWRKVTQGVLPQQLGFPGHNRE
jgi:hypothetical protein